MKVKGLPNLDGPIFFPKYGPRTSHILLDIVFPIGSMPLAKIDICANENLY